MFKVVGGALKNAAIRESNKILGNAVNQIAAKNPIPAIATVGAIQGFANTGNLQGAIKGAAQGVIGAGLQQLGNQIPPQLANAAAALQGITNPAAFTANGWIKPDTLAGGYTNAVRNATGQVGTPTTTYAGTTSAVNPAKVRTQIIDATQGEVLNIKDSFLQGVAGGLSSIVGQGVNNLLGSLPSTMQNLLSTTGLTGALGSAISGGLGKALGGLGNALGDAAGKLASGLGGAIASIPGVGPVFEGFSKGVGEFAKNLDGAVKGLPTDLQRAISGAAAQVGANLIGKALKKPNVVKDVGKQVIANIEFKENPAKQCKAIAEYANACHNKIYKSTQDKTFKEVANNAVKAAKRFGKRLVKKNPYVFKLAILPEDPIVNKVENGKLYTTKERRAIFGEKSSPAKEYQRAYDLVLNDEQINQIVNDNVVPPEVVVAVSELTEKEQDEILAGRIPKSIEKSYVDAVEVKAQAQPKQEVKINTANIVEVKPESKSVVVETRNNDNVLVSRQEYEIEIPVKIKQKYDDDFLKELEEYRKNNTIIIGKEFSLGGKRFIDPLNPRKVIGSIGTSDVIVSRQELRKAIEIIRKKYEIPIDASVKFVDFDSNGNVIGAQFKKAPPVFKPDVTLSPKKKFGGPLVRKDLVSSSRLDTTRQRRTNRLG